MSNQQLPTSNNQSQQTKRVLSRWYKGSLTLGIIASYALYRYIFEMKNMVCIYDAFQEVTINANRPLVQNQSLSAYEGNNNHLTVAGKAFIGTGQVLMDFWIAFIGIIWIIKIRNMRAFTALGIFFLLRGLIFLNIEKLPFPENLAWRSPGFFSFTVPYDHTRDFYYSGHTGSLFIIFLQLLTLDLKIATAFAFISLLFMINMLVITRVHYIIDIIGALIIAIWLYRLSIRYIQYIDKLFSLPLFAAKWIYKNKCTKQPQQTRQNNENMQNMQNMVNGQIIQNQRKTQSQQNKDKAGQLQIQCVQSAQRIRY